MTISSLRFGLVHKQTQASRAAHLEGHEAPAKTDPARISPLLGRTQPKGSIWLMFKRSHVPRHFIRWSSNCFENEMRFHSPICAVVRNHHPKNPKTPLLCHFLIDLVPNLVRAIPSEFRVRGGQKRQKLRRNVGHTGIRTRGKRRFVLTTPRGIYRQNLLS